MANQDNLPAGKPRKLSKEHILASASEIPFNELTIGRLASKLSVTAPAIYSYFSGIEDVRSALALRSIEDAEYLDNQPPGDFSAFMVRFVSDYRGWLEKNQLDTSLFAIDFGAARLKNRPSVPLLKRMEHFLSCARDNGVDAQAALPMYWFLADVMAHSSWITIQAEWVDEFRSKLKEDVSNCDKSQFKEIRKYLEDGGNAELNGEAVFQNFLELMTNALMRRGPVFERGSGSSGSPPPTSTTD